ncbi:streptavidin-V2-like [Saccostrea cucullata]|uniref:streptavidin-V2-like n=1 Tax=Saccostrea cuccullata TaxID=36930 RepID=UPI002ED1A081
MHVLRMEIAGYLLPLLICGVLPVQSLNTNVTKPCMKQQRNENQCALAGKWKNELGSKMEITCNEGTISGRYESTVGQAVNWYDLSGRYLQVNEKDFMVGWSVAWKNQDEDAKSLTSWTGVYYAEKDEIWTQWILGAFKNQTDYWRIYYTNQNVFTRDNEC